MEAPSGRRRPDPLPVHPFLFAAYPVVALLVANLDAAGPAQALRPLVLAQLGAAALFLVLKLLLRDAQRAALASALVLVLFFSYGHLYGALEAAPLFGLNLGRHRLLVPLWILLLAAGLAWILRARRDFRPINRAFNAIAVLALALPLAQLGLFALRSLPDARSVRQAPVTAGLSLPQDRPVPDIYYLVLDGYARDDILNRFYDLDNAPFLSRLEALGFYVARCSQSNYAQTQLSLASSLNADYLDALDEAYSGLGDDRAGITGLIRRNAARRALEELGYQVVAFETGFEATQWEDADVYLTSGAAQGIEDFETLLLRTTAGRVVAEGVAFLNLKPDWEARDRAHRQRILYALEELKRVPALPGPKFVFAHLIIPHWPHVFGPDGQAVHAHPDSVSGYRDQVIFLNKQIEPVLIEILARSATPPVIILQGDHGSVIESPERRMAILNAYYLPDGGSELLYESISPVNTFRLVLNHYFGARMPFLEDRALYSRYERPYDVQLVPDERAGCSEE